MREETGANIRVLPREALPLCAMEGDELVQIVGDISKVRGALQNVSARLRATPPARERVHNGRPIGAHPVAHRGANAMLGPHAGFAHQAPQQLALQAPPPGTELHYRLLCPSARSGSLIGRGGTVIRALREESGARIRIGDLVEGCDDRVVDIMSVEDGLSPVAPAQQAVLRVYQCVADGDQALGANGAGNSGRVSARLLVPKAQIGSLIGRGGSIIESMRRETGATIQILPAEALPTCAEVRRTRLTQSCVLTLHICT
eukprot:1176047-Prorocentrum_minimum.AAC.11